MWITTVRVTQHLDVDGSGAAAMKVIKSWYGACAFSGGTDSRVAWPIMASLPRTYLRPTKVGRAWVGWRGCLAETSRRTSWLSYCVSGSVLCPSHLFIAEVGTRCGKCRMKVQAFIGLSDVGGWMWSG